MARPMQLVAVTLVYSLGTLMAVAHANIFQDTAAVWGYFALIPAAMSIHYANEFADYETDILTNRTPFSGGSGALMRTGLHPELAFRAAMISLSVGLMIWLGGYLSAQLSVVSGAVLIFGVFFGWMYSLPPLKLAWRGWGELDNAMLGGVVLPIYGYVVQGGALSWQIILINLPFGMLVFINLLATTWADREADASVGKYTLATRWPILHLRRLYLAAGILPFILILLFLGMDFIPVEVSFASIGVAPFVWIGSKTYTQIHTPFPTVFTMVVMLLVQLGAWGILAFQW